MTEQEKKLLNMTGKLANGFSELPVEHVSDLNEFVHHIHILQRMILCRPTRRKMWEDE